MQHTSFAEMNYSVARCLDIVDERSEHLDSNTVRARRPRQRHVAGDRFPPDVNAGNQVCRSITVSASHSNS